MPHLTSRDSEVVFTHQWTDNKSKCTITIILPATLYFRGWNCVRAATAHLSPFSLNTRAAGAPEPTVPGSVPWTVWRDAAAAPLTPGLCGWFSAAPKAGLPSSRWWWSSPAPAAPPTAASLRPQPPGVSCPGCELHPTTQKTGRSCLCKNQSD